MITFHGQLAFALHSLFSLTAFATTRYVDVNSTNATPPFTNWAIAATLIQDAVDAAATGDDILVTNGIYATGGRAVHGDMTNRVVVDRPLTLRSVNGPDYTGIQGYQLPSTTNGDGAVRCVYLADGAFLSGFTLTNGATRRTGGYNQMTGGGVWCVSSNAVVSNCVLTANASASDGGGAYSGRFWGCLLYNNQAGVTGRGGGAFASILSNCTVSDNFAYLGGGAYGGFLGDSSLPRNAASYWGGGAHSANLSNCTLTANSAARGGGGGACFGALEGCILRYNYASVGGGAYSNALNNCELDSNSSSDGGGAYKSSLTNCALTGNWAGTGGGASASTLSFCVLTGNHDGGLAGNGGGAFSSILSGCTLSGNMASLGGGAYSSTLDNCALTDNYASSMGGGAYGCTLRNCTLVGNSGNTGGGVSGSGLNNCILYENSAEVGPNYASGSLNFCCTTPLPASGVGNITNAPLLMDLAGRDLRLQSVSPCINAGNNSYTVGTTDLDGRPRIAGGTVDIGAYEFPSPASVLSYAWAQGYGLPTDGSADFADSDKDGHSNWQEWRADTVPTNMLSRLTLIASTKVPTGVAVSWQSVATRSYFLERGTNLAALPAFLNLGTSIPGQSGATTFTDTTATNGGPFFYRVGVR